MRRTEGQDKASMVVWSLEEEVLGVFHVRQIVDDGNCRKRTSNKCLCACLWGNNTKASTGQTMLFTCFVDC